MNQNKYEFFSFNEINFSSEKKRLLGFLDNGGNIQSLKPFPPCVLKNNTGIVLVDKEIVLSQKDFLVNHNLFFGKEYVKINKAFKNSPYISATCKKCKYFKNLFCRGLFNNKFLNDQGRIIEARGQRQYYALAVEYSYGKLICSSRCNFNCYFCGQEKEKIRPFSVFVEPELSVKDTPFYSLRAVLRH